MDGSQSIVCDGWMGVDQSPGDTSSLMYHAVTPAVTVDVTVDVTQALCGQRFGQRVAVTLM